MNVLNLIRLGKQTDEGTFGVLAYNGELVCLSLELPWRENQTGISCIPEGVFPLYHRERWFGTERMGHTYQIDVPGRTGILIHPANLASELEGCIAPGTRLGTLKGRRAVLHSREAFMRMKHMMAGVRDGLLHVQRLST